MLYEDLNLAEKEIIKNTYYNNKTIKIEDLPILLPFKVSIRTFKKVLKQDYSINTRLKNRYLINETYFDKIDCEEKAYILGLIASDGYVSDKNNEIILSSNDKEILIKIKDCLEYTGNIRVSKKGGFKNSKNGYILYFSSKKINKKLHELGFYSNKSLTFSYIPSQIPKELRRHFLRGYFDGDGSITYYQRTYIIKEKSYTYNRMICSIIATEKFINEIIQEFELNKYSITQSKTKELKYLNISAKNELKKFYHLMYDNSHIFMERKNIIWSKNIEGL